MYAIILCLLVSLAQCSDALSSSNASIFKKEYLNPKSVEYEKASGRWYEYMDTLNVTIRDNTFTDCLVLCDENNRIVHILHRWIASIEECRSKAVVFQPKTSDSPEGVLYKMTTNDAVGKLTVLYFDPHPTEGIFVIHRQTHHLPDSYLVTTRQKDPSNLDETIKQVLVALHLDIGNFQMKSKDFGCEMSEERGIKL